MRGEPRIDLVLLGMDLHDPAAEGLGEDFRWSLGAIEHAMPTATAVTETVDRLLDGSGHFVLIWDPRLGAPPADVVRGLVDGPGDVWHAGLLLGQGDRPRFLDFVHPTWMLTADPRLEHEATSWRLSLRACLVRASLWNRHGGPRSEYRALDVAALELGHRWLWAGALPRHVPDLVPPGVRFRRHSACDPSEAPCAEDELRFVLHRAGRRWLRWAAARAVTTRTASARDVARALRVLAEEEPTPSIEPLVDPPVESADGPVVEADAPSAAHERVTILVPTLDRYPFLRVLLETLRAQTVAPHEIVVIDQTAPGRRRSDWRSDFDDLPLVVLERDAPGQSSARNAGLLASTGDVVLFLDDDDEVPPDLVEGHLAALRGLRADVVCGVADEVGAGDLPPEFERRRPSDVFPTNNGSVRRAALERSGLFDLAFDHGARADAELGQRLYRSGAVMMLEPSLRVLHHRAPSGGLRAHKARVVTYARSRRELLARHLPSATEIYLALVHFGPERTREMLAQRLAGTLAGRGGRLRKLAKAAVGVALLPDSLVRVLRRVLAARRLVATTPPVPRLDPGPPEADE